MIAHRNLQKVEVFSIIIMGSDGHAYIIRRRRGSIHVPVDDLAKWAEKRVWWLEDVPTREENLIVALNEAYERYLACKSQELELSADQWLTTSDALAGRLSDLVDRGHEIPKAVMVYLDKPPPKAATANRSRG